MSILVAGAAGMLGRKLAAAQINRGVAWSQSIESLTLVDMAQPERPAFAGKVEAMATDLSRPGIAAHLIASRPDLIFHLAAIVSGEAEVDFDKGHQVNLDVSL